MMAVQAQVSPVITERRNSMIAKTCACSAAGGATTTPICATSKQFGPLESALSFPEITDHGLPDYKELVRLLYLPQSNWIATLRSEPLAYATSFCLDQLWLRPVT
jgi:hypothetical protein